VTKAGEVYKVLYLAQDITEQVKAEQEAKKALVKHSDERENLLNYRRKYRLPRKNTRV